MNKASALVLVALLGLPVMALAQGSATPELNAETAAKVEAARKSEPQITVSGARSEQEAKARLRADAKLRECVIKPVMTDEEINTCTTAYRMSRDAQPSAGR